MIYAVQYSTSSLSATPVFQGATPYVLPTDTKFVSSLPAISNRIPGLNVYVDGLGPGAVGTPILKGYLYSTTTGNLFAQTTPVAVLDGQTARWVNLPFATPAQLPGGSAVNVVLQTGGANNVARIWGSNFATPFTRINLIVNPSFEGNVITPWAISGAGTVATPISTTSATGNVACKVEYPLAAASSAGISANTWGVLPNKQYVFSSYCKGTVGAAMRMYVRVYNDALTNSMNFQNNFTLSTDWRRQSVAFQSGATPSYVLAWIMNTTATPYQMVVDGIVIEEGATPTNYFDGSVPGSEWVGKPHYTASVQLATPVKVNYAPYSDMNMPTADTYWDIYQVPDGNRTATTGKSLDATTFKTGTQSLKYVPDVANTFYFYKHDWNMAPAYVVKPGQVWAISAWFKGPAGRQFLIGAHEFNGAAMGTDVWSGVKTLTGNWDRFTYAYTVPASGVTSFALISVTSGTVGIGESFWFDAPQVELATPLSEYFDGSMPGYKWTTNSYSGLPISMTDYESIPKLSYPYAATPAYALELGQATPNLGSTTGISW